VAGSVTPLSSLIRDDLALHTALAAADAVADKGLELATVRGIDSIHLAVGIAEWNHDDESYRAPILLRPLVIRRAGNDFELKLRGEAFLNPALVRTLHEQFQISLDAHAFAQLAESDGTFSPNPVIDRLRGLTSHLDWFNVQPRLVVSSFAEVAPPMLDDALEFEHPVLDALAGNPSAKWSVEESYVAVSPAPPDERNPDTDHLLLDADGEQENVIAQIAAGNSVVVKTLPGTGGTQTIVNAIGTLVEQSKRVLVVSARRATLRGIAARFNDVGLTGVGVSTATLRRDLIRSISRNEKATQPQLGEVNDALVRLRKVLLDYRAAIGRRDDDLGVSVLDCLTELSRLALLPTPPQSTARLGATTVAKLTAGRAQVADTMVKAARLGEFRYGPGDSPWYGASFRNGDDAVGAHTIAMRLHLTEIPNLLQRGNELVGNTRMRPFTTVSELGVYLRLLVDIRDTLDKFQPVVFDRSLADLIAATSPRREATHLTSTQRRRLKQLAKEYQRPGVHVLDINTALRQIQDQRMLWQRFSPEGVTPQVPVGIADVQVMHQRVMQDLAVLDAPLRASLGGAALADLPIPQLLGVMNGLAAESDVLHNLQERSELVGTLAGLELEPLLADLAARHVTEDQIAAELEQAWWRSALEILLDRERALLGANTGVLDRLEADFRLVDETHAAGSAGLLAWQLAEAWKIGLDDWPDEAAALKKALRRSTITSRELHESAPHLARAIAPVWLASPYDVHEVSNSVRFDTVILVDAGATTLAENAAAIKRGKQVVAFGDPVAQTPSRFEIGVSSHADASTTVTTAAELDELHGRSALAALDTLLPTLTLTRSYRAGGEDLAELVNRRFYAGRIDSLPWAGSFLGHNSIRIDYVEDGTGMPDDDTGAVESIDAEVDRVVELIIEHANQRPKESLMVITASPRHASRVHRAVLGAMTTRPALQQFVVGDRAEPFTVMTIDKAVAESRDRVIFSIGYGRTPHGRVLSDFGPLGHPGGERLLAVAMTRARRAMIIVSCFTAEHLDDARMDHGALALTEVLADVTARTRYDNVPDDSDPLLVDLARRLEARGLRVALGHRGKLGLVASHGGMCLTIETDTALQHSLRESLRLRPALLRRLGWHYLRVHAFELFSNPDAVADSIVSMLGATPVLPPQPAPPLVAVPLPAGDSAPPPTAAQLEPAAASHASDTPTAPISIQSAAPQSADEAPAPRPAGPRRVTTEPAPGSDPHPAPEPLRHAPDENDERLRGDKPPHWG
ncbi:MAG TPA: DUF4011 domain-containing protein, partial [Terrimesophilobacter sp.]|nr:DUF4011 domain-containing protein [Terrimesophilobacter sp.]